jgi:hypothetical protein
VCNAVTLRSGLCTSRNLFDHIASRLGHFTFISSFSFDPNETSSIRPCSPMPILWVGITSTWMTPAHCLFNVRIVCGDTSPFYLGQDDRTSKVRILVRMQRLSRYVMTSAIDKTPTLLTIHRLALAKTTSYAANRHAGKDGAAGRKKCFSGRQVEALQVDSLNPGRSGSVRSIESVGAATADFCDALAPHSILCSMVAELTQVTRGVDTLRTPLARAELCETSNSPHKLACHRRLSRRRGQRGRDQRRGSWPQVGAAPAA